MSGRCWWTVTTPVTICILVTTNSFLVTEQWIYHSHITSLKIIKTKKKLRKFINIHEHRRMTNHYRNYYQYKDGNKQQRHLEIIWTQLKTGQENNLCTEKLNITEILTGAKPQHSSPSLPSSSSTTTQSPLSVPFFMLCS